jgi:hypothetical protein
MTITLRQTKGSALTIAELDGNFQDLDPRVTTAQATATAAGTAASTAQGTANTAQTTAAAAQVAAAAAQAAAAGASGFPTSVAFNTSIPYTGYLKMPEQAVTAQYAFAPNPAGALDSTETIIGLIADGNPAHIPTFAASMNPVNNPQWVNTQGQVQTITTWRENGRYYYGIVPGPLIDTGVPTLSLIAVQNTDKNSVVLQWSENMDPAISAASAFAIPTKTISAHTRVDGIYTYLTVSPPVAYGESLTLNYTPPATNKMRDLAGNLVASISSAAVQNYVLPAASKVRMTALGAYVVESGDATAGWNYYGNPANGGNIQDDTHGASSTKKLAASADGHIRCKITGISGDNGNPFKGVFGFDLDPTVTERGTLYGLYYGHDGSANVYYANAGQYNTVALNGTVLAPANNDEIRVRRAGTNIVLEVSKNAGTSWTVVHTYSSASQAALYGKLHVSNTCAFENIQSDAMA